MRTLCASLFLLALALPTAAATSNNDDSCDIGTYPAATLLLPYFEVDIATAGTGRTTIFSITNVSPVPQIVHVTIWSDWAYPVISFPIFLTGYDVQPINLYDVIVRGLLAPPNGTSTSSPNPATNPNAGTTPKTNLANPNFLAEAAGTCARGSVPGQLPSSINADVLSILTTGRTTLSAIRCGGQGDGPLGSNHGQKAVGYVTADVLATCSPLLPTDAQYWGQLLYDNVITGDYQIINSNAASGNYAAGNPMVHIRAIPEGGPAGATLATDLPFTFYNRFTSNDRRQPLPSTFAARWIAGSTAAFETEYTIWREAITGLGAACATYDRNSSMVTGEIVRFDERENAWLWSSGLIDPPIATPLFPASSRNPSTFIFFPQTTTTDSGGWMYFNLNNSGRSYGAQYTASRPGYGVQPNSRDVSQNWVTVSMFAEGRFGVESDATSLGNGCSPAAPPTTTTNIAPAKNVNP